MCGLLHLQHSNSIFCQFCKCWSVNKICCGIRGKLKQEPEFKFKQLEKDTKEYYPVAELDGQYFEIVGKICYLGDTVKAKGSAVDCVLARIRNGWSKFQDLLPLFERGLCLGAKGI